MPLSTEAVEKLAQHYYLTPALIQQAAELFDLYTRDDAGPADAEARISIKRLQQLLVALGDPLSQQDVVEILQLLSASASTAISPQNTPGVAAAATPTTPTAATAAPATATTSGASRAAAASSSPSSSVRKANAGNRTNTAAAAAPRSQSNKPSSRRSTSAPPTATDGEVPSSEDLTVTPSTLLLTPTARALTAADSVVFTAEEEKASNSSLLSSSPLHTSAVTLHGMTFPAFVYFLMVYPTLVQHIFRHSSSTAAGPTTTVFNSVDVADLFAQLDSDGDGVCSAQDIRRVAERCATDYDGLLLDDPDLCRLAEMHPVELESAIGEFDVDGDGAVTLGDLMQALQY